MLKGSLVALITPMNQDGSINYEQLHDLIDWHIENGTDGIVAVGTTGESATLPVEEHLAVIEATVKHVNKRVPVICGLHLICCSLLQQTFARRHLPTFQSHRRSHFDSDDYL